MNSENPAYTVRDFRAAMPIFTAEKAPDALVETYLEMAHAVVREPVWHSLWREGMRLFVAHFLSLYLEGVPQAAGTVASERVGEVSVSYDSAASGDLKGWAAWRETSYGRQFATLARTFAKPGLYVL